MKKVLLILNQPAYGADETFNAIRPPTALTRRDDTDVTVFLMVDAVTCAMAGQKTPDVYYTLDRMLKSFARHGGHIASCGTCLDARRSHQGALHLRGTPAQHGGTGGMDRGSRPSPHLLTPSGGRRVPRGRAVGLRPEGRSQ